MKPSEMQELAALLQQMPGIKSIDLRDVKRLAQLLRESPEIGSIEVTGFFGTGVVITRTGSGAVAAPAAPAPAPTAPATPTAAPAAAPQAAPVGEEAPAPVASNFKEIKSPMVGTYYSAPEPGAEAYVKVGQRVSPGATLCIIEAMKIMNEIEAEISGVIKEVCVEDAQPVEYGQVLFRVDPNG